MRRRGLLAAAVAALLLFPAIAEAAKPLMPGVSYETQRKLIGGGPVVLHILKAPRHGGLYSLRPVLSNGTVLGRRTIPQIQAAVAPKATTAGVNGDFFRWDDGRPSGIFLRDGILAAGPHAHRSSLAIAFDGSLLVDRFRFVGSWRGGGNPAHPIEQLNRPLDNPPGVALFTRSLGGPTPRVRGAVEVVLSGFPPALLNGTLTGTVTAVRRDGGQAVPRGAAVLQARGPWRAKLLAEAPVGTQVTVRLQARDIPDDVADAIGGGPELVRNGVPVQQTDEWFTLSQIRGRHPRTAVGQLADGRLILVVADGRRSSSIGLTNAAMARTMAGLGAVTAIGLDGGGSSTMAFDGRVLNRPSDGRPRAVSSGLLVFYYGIYAPPLPAAPLTPNRDGVADRRKLTVKVVRRSAVDLELLRPNGTRAWRYQGVADPGWIVRRVGKPTMAEGRWRWRVSAVELASGRDSSMSRAFVVNKTLGHLKLSAPRLTIGPGKRRKLGVAATLTRAARLTVRVETGSGALRRLLFSDRAEAGRQTWYWNGRNASGRRVPAGRYVVEVTARTSLGAVTLRKGVVVVRASGSPGPG